MFLLDCYKGLEKKGIIKCASAHIFMKAKLGLQEVVKFGCVRTRSSAPDDVGNEIVEV